MQAATTKFAFAFVALLAATASAASLLKPQGVPLAARPNVMAFYRQPPAGAFAHSLDFCMPG